MFIIDNNVTCMIWVEKDKRGEGVKSICVGGDVGGIGVAIFIDVSEEAVSRKEFCVELLCGDCWGPNSLS